MTVAIAVTGGAAAAPLGAAAVGTTAAATAGGTAAATAGTTAAAAAAGGTVGAATAAGVGPAAAIVAGGPIVWGVAIFGAIVVGAEHDGVEAGFTWECWKDLVHEDASSEPSTGRILSELLDDTRVREYHIDHQSNLMFIQNIWGEWFKAEHVPVPKGVLAPGLSAMHLRQCQGVDAVV